MVFPSPNRRWDPTHIFEKSRKHVAISRYHPWSVFWWRTSDYLITKYTNINLQSNLWWDNFKACQLTYQTWTRHTKSPKTEKKKTYWWTPVLCVIKCFPVNYNNLFSKNKHPAWPVEFLFRTWVESQFPSNSGKWVGSCHPGRNSTPKLWKHVKDFFTYKTTIWKLLPSKISHRRLPSFLPFPSLNFQGKKKCCGKLPLGVGIIITPRH